MKMKICRHILVLCLSYFSIIVFGQDTHQSQFYSTPILVNPAQTGVSPCTQRITANYREQWLPFLGSERFSTISATYEIRFPVGRYDYWAMGLGVQRDIAGTTRLSNTSGMMSFSYIKHLAGSRRTAQHFLSVGADIGGAFMGLDIARARYSPQHTNGTYDPSIPSGESFENESINYLDISTGLLLYGRWKSGHSYYIGAAAHHVNRPSMRFLSGDNELQTKITLQGGGNYKLNTSSTLIYHLIYLRQNPHTQLNSGFAFRQNISTRSRLKKAFKLGLWTRVTQASLLAPNPDSESELYLDAIIPYFSISLDQLELGFSYDINVSELTEGASLNNALEFSLNYNICGPEKRNVFCPYF